MHNCSLIDCEVKMDSQEDMDDEMLFMLMMGLDPQPSPEFTDRCYDCGIQTYCKPCKSCTAPLCEKCYIKGGGNCRDEFETDPYILYG